MKTHTKRQLRMMRDKEFLDVYRKVADAMMQSNEPFVRREAIRRTLAAGRPLFYLSYNRAYTVVLHHAAHGDVPLKAQEQRGMWLELCAAVTAMRALHPDFTLPQALARTLATAHASRFYLSEAYASKLLYRIVRDRRNARRYAGRYLNDCR